MPKVAVLLLADTETHADKGRAANALMTVQEFAEAGDEATLIFDGAGTRWAAEFAKEGNDLHPLFARVRDHVAGACHYCAGAFDVRDQLERDGIPLLRENKGHPSVRRLVCGRVRGGHVLAPSEAETRGAALAQLVEALRGMLDV